MEVIQLLMVSIHTMLEMLTYSIIDNPTSGQDDYFSTLEVGKSQLLLVYGSQPSDQGVGSAGIPLLYQLDINKARPGYIPD